MADPDSAYLRWLADRVESLDYRLLPLLGHVPRSLAIRLADWRGDIRYRLRRELRNRAESSIRAFFCHENADARRLAQEMFRVNSQDELETFWFTRNGDSELDVAGLPALMEALAEGNGALLVTGHLGCVGAFMHGLGTRGCRLNIVHLPLSEVSDRPAGWQHYGRTRIRLIEGATGRPMLYTRRNRYFRMRRQLRKGEVLLIAVDVPQRRQKHTVPVDFLGRPAFFPVGPARLWSESNARLFFGVIHRDRSRVHRVTIEELSHLLPSRDDWKVTTQLMVNRLERAIREHPQDWLMWDSAPAFFRPRA